MRSPSTWMSLLCLLLVMSCQKDELSPSNNYYPSKDAEILEETLRIPLDKPYNYNVFLPSYVNGPDVGIDRDKATMGRVLFYDKKLSRSGTVSCASCHQPQHAFSSDQAFSIGSNGRPTDRNTPAIGSVLSPSLYYSNPRPVISWDNSMRGFWHLLLTHMREENIMDDRNWTSNQGLRRVRSSNIYKPLLSKAYSHLIEKQNVRVRLEEQTIHECLEAFVLSLASTNSKFDRAYAGLLPREFDAYEDRPLFSAEENKGKRLYMEHCSNCHGNNFSEPFVTEANNGLDEVYVDKGIGALTDHPLELGGETYEGVFKVPVLKNIALSAPYMHDGRFSTLEEVIEHYSTGVRTHRNLHKWLKDEQGNATPFYFSESEKRALKAFLLTLTDDDLTNEDKYSDPFK